MEAFIFYLKKNNRSFCEQIVEKSDQMLHLVASDLDPCCLHVPHKQDNLLV